jgi:hypothetical protein
MDVLEKLLTDPGVKDNIRLRAISLALQAARPFFSKPKGLTDPDEIRANWSWRSLPDPGPLPPGAPAYLGKVFALRNTCAGEDEFGSDDDDLA